MVSAVILSYNRCSEVLNTISKLKIYRSTLPFDLEIIVVDNASVDDTTLFIKESHPDVILVTKQKNNGIAGWNEGFKIAKYKYFLVLDDDSCIQSGLVDAIEKLEEETHIGILALNIVDEQIEGDPNLSPDEAWKDGENIAGYIGCGAIITKRLFETIGGYAEWIHLYTHEFEYSIRALNAGFKVNFFEKGIVVHRVSKINRSSKTLRIFSTRNEMAIIYSYFGNNKLKYLVRTWVNNFKFIKREGISAGYYVFLGALAFFKMRKKLKVTPVKEEVQNFYAENFWSTKAI